MGYTPANETQITEAEKNEAYALLTEMGFIEEDLNYLETLNSQALRHETDFERIDNAA